MLQTEAQQTFRLRGCSPEPMVVNAGGAGFYRVEYEPAHLEALQRRFPQLAAADQVTLLSDSFALAQAGAAPLQTFFGLLAALPQIQGPGRQMLTAQAGDAITMLDEAFAGTPSQAALRAAGRALLAPELRRLGWSPRAGDDAETLNLRGTLIERLARFDDPATADEARRRFDRDASGAEALPATTRAAVVRAAGMHADRARFDALLANLKGASGEEDRWLFASALAGGRDAARAAEFLEVSLAGDLPPNIATSIPGMVARRSPFGEQAYRFAAQHWSALAALAGREGRHWLLPSAAEGFNAAAQAARLIDDQKRLSGPDGAALAARFAARIELLDQIKQREAVRLADFLAAWQPAVPSAAN